MHGAPPAHVTVTLPRAAERGPTLTGVQSGQGNMMNRILTSKRERIGSSGGHWGGRGQRLEGRKCKACLGKRNMYVIIIVFIIRQAQC